MPEYLAPGVFVEEVSFRQKTIEGVSTSTAGFVGPARFGPLSGEPPLITSFTDFERIYGGLDAIRPGGTEIQNHLAHAVRAFFEEGGKRLYVARIYIPGGRAAPPAAIRSGPGRGLADRRSPSARGTPGAAGDIRVNMVFRLGEKIKHLGPAGPELRGALNFDTVLATPASRRRARPAWTPSSTGSSGCSTRRPGAGPGGCATTTRCPTRPAPACVPSTRSPTFAC